MQVEGTHTHGIPQKIKAQVQYQGHVTSTFMCVCVCFKEKKQ